RPLDVVRLDTLLLLAEVVVREVEKAGPRRERGGLPIFAAGRCRTDIVHHLAEPGPFLLDLDGTACLEVDSGRRGDVNEWFGGEDLAGHTVHDIDVAIAVGMEQHLPRTPANGEIREDVFVDAVVVVEIVGADLHRPLRTAAVSVAREQCRGPLVVARTLIRVPRPRVRRAVIDKV